jgi:hypothetical protein
MSAGDRAIRVSAVIAVLVVTGIAAVISYGHAHDLVEAYGEPGVSSYALPLTVDGLIATTGLVLLDAARRGARPPFLAWLLLAAGIAATLGANIAHGLSHGLVGAAVAGWPALVATGCFELLTRMIRSGREGVDNINTLDLETDPEPVADGWDRWETIDPEPVPATVGTTPMDPTVALVATGDLEPDPELEELVATARDRFGTEVPSVNQLRRALKVGHPKATAVRAELEAAPVLNGSQPH